MSVLMKKDGFAFEFDPKACEECGGGCCIGESGYIWVTPSEITALCESLNLKRDEFINKRGPFRWHGTVCLASFSGQRKASPPPSSPSSFSPSSSPSASSGWCSGRRTWSLSGGSALSWCSCSCSLSGHHWGSSWCRVSLQKWNGRSMKCRAW